MVAMRSAPTWARAWFPLLPADRHTWVVVALGLVTVAGAMVQSYTQKRAFGEHARQYARMADTFTRAGDRMSALLHDGKTDRAGELAVELGSRGAGGTRGLGDAASGAAGRIAEGKALARTAGNVKGEKQKGGTPLAVPPFSLFTFHFSRCPVLT